MCLVVMIVGVMVMVCGRRGLWALWPSLSNPVVVKNLSRHVRGVSTHVRGVYIRSYKASNIAQHRCLRLVANSEQILNSRVSRRLITMQKIHHYQACSKLLYKIFYLVFTDITFCTVN